jgi:hypothetical protein
MVVYRSDQQVNNRFDLHVVPCDGSAGSTKLVDGVDRLHPPRFVVRRRTRARSCSLRRPGPEPSLPSEWQLPRPAAMTAGSPNPRPVGLPGARLPGPATRATCASTVVNEALQRRSSTAANAQHRENGPARGRGQVGGEPGPATSAGRFVVYLADQDSVRAHGSCTSASCLPHRDPAARGGRSRERGRSPEGRVADEPTERVSVRRLSLSTTSPRSCAGAHRRVAGGVRARRALDDAEHDRVGRRPVHRTLTAALEPRLSAPDEHRESHPASRGARPGPKDRAAGLRGAGRTAPMRWTARAVEHETAKAPLRRTPV